MLDESLLGRPRPEPRWENDYPDEPQPQAAAPRRPPRPGAARRAAGPARAIARALSSDLDRSRLIWAAVLGVFGLLLGTSAALADGYFHRGISTGEEASLVLQPTGRELATNIDLTIIRPDQVEGVVQQLQLANFRFVRQTFLWSTIEPQQGTFDWSRYDPIVEALTSRKITVVAVLSRTPAWARSPESQNSEDAPPLDPATFASFVTQFVQHYPSSQIPFVQIWDRPNLPSHWGGVAARPSDYGGILAPASNAISATQPATQVLLAELEPFPSGGMSDLDFLRGMYRAGVSDFFDIVAVGLDGGGRSPFDRSVREDRLNLSRAVLFHEVMEDAGDGETPIWSTHFGWAAGSGANEVSPELQAAFVIDGLDRARREWPWMGPMFMWGFLPLASDSWAPYALLTTDGKSTALFEAVGKFGRAGGSEAASTGFVPVDARSVEYDGNWTNQILPPQQTYKTTSELDASVTITFRGSGLIAYLRQSANAGSVGLTLDGKPIAGLDAALLQSFQAANVPYTLVAGLDDSVHELTLTLESEGELTMGGAVVTRDFPFLWPVVLLTGGAAVLIFLGFREVAYVIAIRTGHLRRRRVADPWHVGARPSAFFGSARG